MSKFASREFDNRQYYIYTGLVYPSQCTACMSLRGVFLQLGEGRNGASSEHCSLMDSKLKMAR